MPRYGRTTRALHWAMAALMIWLLWLGARLAWSEPSLALIPVFTWHKSLGLVVFALALIRLVWHRIAPPPKPVDLPPMQYRLARTVHVSMYVLMVALPLSGWIGSAALGPDVLAFGLALPRIVPVSQALSDTAFTVHEWLAYALLLCLALHVSGTAYHRNLARIVTG
ncbi:hypothetical protein HKCCE3408_15635 [Rhodobacterales bacterium HKCCE3408]|nr:hypothetical protein [Rhodobacterales bacterium HKCCE3408]